jgi:hypothetical protein
VKRELTDLLHICVRWNANPGVPVPPRFRFLDVMPEPEHPAGRKGLMLARAWETLATPRSDGMLILDGDCAIDPLDYAAMITEACTEPDAVWTAPVRLWPASTGFRYWVWGHREVLAGRDPLPSDEETRKIWQADISNPVMFTFNFTFLPRRLMQACTAAGMAGWAYPQVDENTWRTALDQDIPVHVARRGCSPKHVNY